MTRSTQQHVPMPSEDEQSQSNESKERSTSSSCSSEKLPYLFELIQESDWKQIRKCLQSDDAYRLCRERDESNLSCLALAMAQNAPMDIIKEMVNIDPSLPSKCDEYGATALHVGSLNGATFESIDYLLELNPDLALELDFDDRSALHHAVEYTCGDYTSEKLRNVDVIRRLCEVAPEMVNAQDNIGGTPIDLIQLIKIKLDTTSQAYIKLDQVYQYLKSVSVEVYRKRKKQWEAESREERAKDGQQKSRTTRTPSAGLPSTSESRLSYPSKETSITDHSHLMNVSVFNDIRFSNPHQHQGVGGYRSGNDYDNEESDLDS